MSLAVLIRRTVLDPVRTGSIYVLVGVFVLAFGLLGYLFGSNSSTPVSPLVASFMGFLVPLAAFAYSYDSIAGPRERGSLRVLLTYPYSRFQVVAGTLVGRVVVLGSAVLVGVLTAAVTTLVFGGSVDPIAVVAVLALALLLSTAIVGIGVGVSAAVSTTNRAAMAVFTIYLLFFAFWGQLPTIVRFLLNDFQFPTGPPPEWALLWAQLNPFTAYNSAVQALLSSPISPAVYHALWFCLAVMVAWFGLVVGLGVWRFDRVDL